MGLSMIGLDEFSSPVSYPLGSGSILAPGASGIVFADQGATSACGIRQPTGTPTYSPTRFEELLARVADIELLGEPTYSPAGIRSMICYSAKEIPVRLIPR